jgi:hypothetical protein
METVLISFVSMALIIISTVTMTVSTFQSANKMADSWKVMEEQASIIMRTEITALPPAEYEGGVINLTVRNAGHVDLSDFSRWDVIFQYQSGSASYLTYAAAYPPGGNQWAVNGIYISEGVPEVFEPAILNPGELMMVSVNPSPGIGEGEAGRITLSTPSGVTAQCQVIWPPPPPPPPP